MKRVVFEGQTGVGRRTIHEGDILEFTAVFSGDKCTAFYSTEFTEANKRIGQISFRLERYQYGSMTDCHSYDSGKLITHILSGPKEVRRSGFGKWISSQERRDIVDEQTHV